MAKRSEYLGDTDEKKVGFLQSKKKLHDAGHVDWVSNTSGAVRASLEKVDGYFIPWRFVENEGSISIPV